MKKLIEQAIDEPEVKYSAAGIIMRKGDGNVDELLMIQRAKTDYWPLEWEFPRGSCEKGKDKRLRDCAIREIKEETGLDVKPLKLIDKYVHKKDGVTTYCFNYVCKMLKPDQEVRLSKEHKGYKWISEVGEVELMATPEQKKTINKVLNNERSIVSYPRHQKVAENLDFYLGSIQQEVAAAAIPAVVPAAASGIGSAVGGALSTAAGTLLPIYFSALLIKLAVDVYKNNFTKAAKKCKGYAAGEKQICMLRAQISGKKAALNKLQTNINKCKKDRNPQECNGKISAKIQNMQQEIGYLFNREKELRGAPPTR